MQTANLKIEQLGDNFVITGVRRQRRPRLLGGGDASPGAGKTKGELETSRLLSSSKRARDRIVDSCMQLRANCMLSMNVPRELAGEQCRRLDVTKETDYVRMDRMAKRFESLVKRSYPDWQGYVIVADLGRESGRLGLHVACTFDGFGTAHGGKPVRPHAGTLRGCWQQSSGSSPPVVRPNWRPRARGWAPST